ncbi:MAG: helix-turn-helix domain-containing protein [Deltaproteobacteria bacterium]
MEEKECVRETKIYMTIKDVSTYLSIKIKTLYAMAAAGEIPHFRIGRLLRFGKQDIDAWIETKRVKAQTHQAGTRRTRSAPDIDNIVRKVIDAAKIKSYNISGKSDPVKGLRKEVRNGII